MTGEDRGTETGFGIGTKKHSDLNNPLIEVDVKKQEVTVQGQGVWTFADFLLVRAVGDTLMMEGDFT